MKKEIKDWIHAQGISFLAKAGIRDGYHVLDFGCKNGNYTIPVAMAVGKTGIVYALDKNNERLDKLMERAKTEGLENIRRIDTSGEVKIPLKDKTVDAVLLYDVIHLVGRNNSSTVNDRKRLYEEVYRVAKDGAFISVYPTHLTTHTDISSTEEVKEELTKYFKFERELSVRLVHDDNFIYDKVLNFRKIIKVIKCRG
jgi:ubiquinone/menaquinone biosynthesis C-methylase UbiE